MDREKVIKGIECCNSPNRHDDCPYNVESHYNICTHRLLADALALLKEQKAVKPRNTYSETPSGKFIPHIFCGHCDKEIYAMYTFCPFCGQAVKWE